MAATLVVAGVLAACGGKESPAVAGETGGTMIVASTLEPQTLFPPRAESSEEVAIVASVFDRLADIGDDLSAVGDAGFTPRLASAWTWASDSLSIAFALDPRARWHDGTPVRAEDVRFTFHAYTADAVASEAKSLLGNIDSVSVRDSLTAVFWFKRRTPQQFLDATYPMFILPSHLLSTLPDSALVNDAFARQPVGTGRFRFSKWEPGTRLEIVSDTTNARGRAKLDRVIWTFVSDFGAATVKLFAGEADFYEKIRPENLAQVTSAPSLRLVTNRPLAYNFAGFNTRARRSAGPGAPPHPIFGDVRVRRAFTMAMDRPRMVRTTLDTMGSVSLAPAPRALIPDTAALKPLPYDLAAARALLDSAGWTDTNNDGVRERNGQPLAFELLVPSSSANLNKFSVLVQAALKEVGATVTIQALDGAALGPRIDAHDFDAYLSGWQTNPGLQGLRQTWMSRGASNYQGYASAIFDAEVDSALTAFDPARTRAHFTRAFQQAIEDAPSVWLFETRTPVALHRRINPAPLRADGWYAHLADWTIDPAQRLDRDRIGLGAAR